MLVEVVLVREGGGECWSVVVETTSKFYCSCLCYNCNVSMVVETKGGGDGDSGGNNTTQFFTSIALCLSLHVTIDKLLLLENV